MLRTTPHFFLLHCSQHRKLSALALVPTSPFGTIIPRHLAHPPTFSPKVEFAQCDTPRGLPTSVVAVEYRDVNCFDSTALPLLATLPKTRPGPHPIGMDPPVANRHPPVEVSLHRDRMSATAPAKSPRGGDLSRLSKELLVALDTHRPPKHPAECPRVNRSQWALRPERWLPAAGSRSYFVTHFHARVFAQVGSKTLLTNFDSQNLKRIRTGRDSGGDSRLGNLPQNLTRQR